MTTTRETTVNVAKATRTYIQGDTTIYALNQVDLLIGKGEFTSLAGPSGSGKTTLLNVIGALDKPTSGKVTVDNVVVSSLSGTKRSEFRLQNIGFVFQAFNLIPVLSAVENVEFVMQLQGLDAKNRRELAVETLKEVGLGDMLHRRPGELSGGQQQRVAVARAIVNTPRLVLADEPTANLDSKTAHALIELMKKMNKEHGVTFIFSTHDELVMKSARRLIHLQDGKIINDQIQTD